MKPGLPSPAFWRGKSVLLTGHTGFKGAWTALWLAELGARVTGLALAPDTTPNLFDLTKTAELVDSRIGDIRERDLIAGVAQASKPDIVLHMAAQALVRRSYREPIDTFSTNVMGTVKLLDALRTIPTVQSVLVITSDKVYENDGTGGPFDEPAPLGGHDPYAASKAAAEIAVASYRRSFFADTETRVASARGGNVIGGGDFSEDRIVPDIWRAHRAQKPLVLRYPNATRPWQHVLDCVGGYLLYAERLAQKATDQTALNFGPRERMGSPVRDLVTAMQGAIGAAHGWVQADGPLPTEMPALALTSDRAAKALGWHARLDAKATIDWTADWYKSYAKGENARAITQAQIRRYQDT